METLPYRYFDYNLSMEPSRKPTRLPGYDYSQAGYYFVTICTHNKIHLFGEITSGNMILNQLGEIVVATWTNLPKHFIGISIDDFIVMPNHLHGIIIIEDVKTPLKQTPIKNPSLVVIVGSFKTWSARKINALTNRTGKPVWQRSFYDHVIRNETGLNHIREYIINNPIQWGLGEDDY